MVEMGIIANSLWPGAALSVGSLLKIPHCDAYNYGDLASISPKEWGSDRVFCGLAGRQCCEATTAPM